MKTDCLTLHFVLHLNVRLLLPQRLDMERDGLSKNWSMSNEGDEVDENEDDDDYSWDIADIIVPDWIQIETPTNEIVEN